MTRSWAITWARFFDQCGSEYVRRTRCRPILSAHSGSMAAFWRPHSRDVSTSSPAITKSGCFLASPEPGKIANFAPRAPRYSWIGRLPVPLAACSRSSLEPICESSPDSRAWWIRSASGAASLVSTGGPGFIPMPFAIWRSCDSSSCHSRTRRWFRCSWRHIRRNELDPRSRCCSRR